MRSTDPAPPETDETDESAPDTSPPVDEAPSVPDTTPDAPPATAAPTTAPAPGRRRPPQPRPGAAVAVDPGDQPRAGARCPGRRHHAPAVPLGAGGAGHDPRGQRRLQRLRPRRRARRRVRRLRLAALTGRWTVRATGATGTFSFRDDPLLGWQGDLGGVPDTLSGGASSPFDLVLTAVDPSGNRWSVGTTATLEDC